MNPQFVNGSRLSSVLGRFLFLGILLLTSLPGSTGPLSERVMFVAQRNGLDKLYICRPDGRDLKRFCKELGSQSQATYSKKLQRVFFVRRIQRKPQICSVNTEGRDLRVEVDILADVAHPNVSPDGLKLIFSTDLWGSLELAEMELQTGELNRLTYNQGINTYPRYSPNGKRIAYLSRNHGHSEIYLWNRSQDKSIRLTKSRFHKGPPSWNPSSTRIIATKRFPPRFESRLIEIDLESGQDRQFLPEVGNVKNPSYSVDGTRVIFTKEQEIFTFDLSDTTNLPFPLKGTFAPKEAIWIPFPLP